MFWKLEKEVKLVLAPGACHEHILVNYFHKVLKGTKFADQVSDTTMGIRGSHYTLIVAYGAPGNSAGGATVSTVPACIDVVSTREIKFTPYNIPVVTSGRKDFDNLVTLATPGGMNLDTAAAVAETKY